MDRARSFRGAAAQLGYVQSAVSRQVAALEEAAGSRLVDRSQGPRPVELTEAGRLLLAHAREILASMEAAKADLDALLAGSGGCVRIGAFPGVPARLLGPTVAALAARFPEIRVLPTETTTDTPLFELVEHGKIDLAFSFLPPAPGPFAHRQLLQVPWVLLTQAGTPIGCRETSPTPAELARLPLITATSSRMCCEIETELRAEGTEPNVVFRTDMMETLQDLVATGVGAALVPSVMVDRRDGRIAVVELGETLPPLGICVIWHSHRRLSRSVVRFRDLLSEVCSAPDVSNDPGRFVPVLQAGAGLPGAC